MDNLSLFKCKNCGDLLDVRSAVNGVVECKYCHTPWTVPKQETSPEALKYLHDGSAALDVCKFEDAFTYYQKAAEFDPKEPEAYFGMAIASFKIQYLQDSVNNRLQPICHEVTKRKIFANKNYQTAISLATAAQRVEYERRAAEIDYICDQFYRFSQTDLHYDSFICVKVTDNETGNHTTDSKDADYIYRLLKERGYSPFYSEYEIRNKTGSDYEAHILYALYSSECMLIVCNNESYLQTKWVKNEYTRFLQLVNDEKKEDDSITIVFHGTPIERLPGRPGKLQGIDFGLRESDNKIIEFVESHTPHARKKREEMLKKKQEEEEKRQQEEERIHQQIEQLNQRLQNVQNAGGGAMATLQSLLTRAEQELMANSFDSAAKFYDRVLEADPFNGYAWWGMLLIEYGVKNENIILEKADWQTPDKIDNDRNYINAAQYADDVLKKRIQRFSDGLKAPERWWNAFLNDMNVSDESEILGSITAKKIEQVTANHNYNLAKKYAAGSFLERVTAFENGLYSPETNWRLFLEQQHVTDESELLPPLTPKMLQDIESNILYRNATREATGPFRDRLDSFTLQLHSGDLWWDKFLKAKKVTSPDEIIEKLTADTITTIEEDPLYQNANKYATGPCEDVVRKFNSEMYSGERWWNKFLGDFHVEDEEGILSELTPALVEKVHGDHNYQRAKSYAVGEVRDRIDRLESQFVSSELWWDHFLSACGVSGDEEFFEDPDRLDPDVLQRVTSDECFLLAEQYADAAMSARIQRFIGRLKSSKLWWDLFLHGLNVTEPSEFFDALPPDGVERVESDRYFANAKQYAAEEEKAAEEAEEEPLQEETEAQAEAAPSQQTAIEEIREFDGILHSHTLWWNTFLKKYEVEEADQLLSNYTENVDATVRDDPYFWNAYKFSDPQQKKSIEALRAKLDERHRGRMEATKAWATLLKSFNARNEEDLNRLYVPVKKHKSYEEAIRIAEQNGCVDLVDHYLGIGVHQAIRVKINKRKKHVRTAMNFLKGFLSVIAGLLLYAAASSLFLFYTLGSLIPVELPSWLATPDEAMMQIPVALVCASIICAIGLFYLLCTFRKPKRMWVAGVTHVGLYILYVFTQHVCSEVLDPIMNNIPSVCALEVLLVLASLLFYIRMGIKPTHVHQHIWLFVPLVFFESMLLSFDQAWIAPLEYDLFYVLCAIIVVFMLSMLPHALYGNISRCLFCVALIGGAFWHISAADKEVGLVSVDLPTFFQTMFSTSGWIYAIVYIAVLIVLAVVATKVFNKIKFARFQKKKK